MIKCMLTDLEKVKESSEAKSDDHMLTECLMQGSKSKKYVPLMQRQKSGKFV